MVFTEKIGGGTYPMRLSIPFLVLATLVAGCGTAARPFAAPAPAQLAQAAAKAKGGSFTAGSFDGRGYKLYAPVGAEGPRPLVVMLHGCTQDPDDFAKGTQMNELGAKEGFYVLYPHETRQDHPMACMPWYDPQHWQRGKGQAAQIVGMVEQVAKQAKIDRKQVFIAGISAGGAYAGALAAAYPDVFAAVGVASGLEYAAAENEMSARMAMMMGGPDPRVAGRKAYEAMGKQARVMPAIVFHGTADYVVQARNADQVARQWCQTADLATNGKDDDDVDDQPDDRKTAQAPGGRSYTAVTFNDKAGHEVVRQVLVDGMSHAWAGGNGAGSYTDPKGPDASAMMWQFFQAHPQGAAPAKKAK